MKEGKYLRVLQKVVLAGMVIGIGVLLVNNVLKFDPNHGFDGVDHIEYVRYVAENWRVPLPHKGWQFYQTPLYYFLGALVYTASSGSLVWVQALGIVVFGLIGYFSYNFFKKSFDEGVSEIGLMGVLALPMLSYLVPLISNELLSGFFVVVNLLLAVEVARIDEYKLKLLMWWVLVSVLGFYTKYTTLSVMPVFVLAFLLNKEYKKRWKSLVSGLAGFGVLILPVVGRNLQLYGTPIALTERFFEFQQPKEARNLVFFLRLDWIYKLELFNAQHFSFLGGLWNSFWHDGHNVITPVVPFHKKALGLFVLGFPLSGVSLYGFLKMYKKRRKIFYVLSFYVLLAVGSLVFYTLDLPYYFTVKAFYALGLVVPYVYGLMSAVEENKWLRLGVVGLLVLQFGLMVSYFMIQGWYHFAR